VTVVLDTSCLRGTPLPSLAALRSRGVAILVSGLALQEIAVHFRNYDPRRGDSENQRRWKARMKTLSNLLNGTPSFAPTHTPLIHKLGGRHRELPLLSFPSWANDMQIVWEAISKSSDQPLAPAVISKINLAGEYVKETGVDFVETSHAMARSGSLEEHGLDLFRAMDDLIPDMFDDIWLPAPGAKERFDAYRKLSRSHSESAYDRATGRARAHEENDAIDLNLLHHLAEGEIILVTRDCRLVESVDKCGTVQAPWVRTVGEVLSGQIPTGPSFGENARRETDRHRPRRRKDLQQLDAEQEKRLKDEGGSLAEAVRP
jgi:hypothetical protein